MKSLLALVVVLAGGCSLYSGHGDDVCETPVANLGEDLRNPQTGQCQVVSTGGGGGSGECGVAEPNANDAGASIAPPPAWGQCDSMCDYLAESDCQATPGCQAAYLDPQQDVLVPANGTPVAVPPQYWACWATGPDGPIEGGGCSTLAAGDCVMHDDCTIIYSGDGGSDASNTNFERCAPEGGGLTCGNMICPVGDSCENNCDPLPPGALPGACSPQCVPALDPGSCTGTITCNIAGPSCPTGTTPGIENGCFTGYCIPLSACGSDPGTCEPVTGQDCAIAPPTCPTGSVAGVTNGCATGYCIPSADCPVIACGDVMGESACLARTDCTAVYDGTGCTCSNGQCTCTGEAYDHCADPSTGAPIPDAAR